MSAHIFLNLFQNLSALCSGFLRKTPASSPSTVMRMCYFRKSRDLSAQLSEDAYKGRIYIHIFIRVSVRVL